jgi:hypothetical protein
MTGNLQHARGGLAQFEETFPIRTLAGFWVTCKLSGFIYSLVRPLGFLDAKAIRQIVQRWYDEVFVPIALENAFFAAGFANLLFRGKGDVRVWLYRVYEERGQRVIHVDGNGTDTINIANAASWDDGDGCAVELLLLDRGFAPEFDEENFAMIDARSLAKIQSRADYDILIEHATMDVRKAVADIVEQAHQTSEQARRALTSCHAASADLVVDAVVSGVDCRISWEKRGGFRQGRYEVLGFRTTGGFTDDPWSESKNGTRIVHSYSATGVTGDHLTEGETYFYTFFIKDVRKGQLHSWLRFQLRAPSAAERAEQLKNAVRVRDLENELHRAMATKSDDDQSLAGLRKMVDDMGPKADIISAAFRTAQDIRADISRQPWFKQMPEGEQETLLEYINSIAETVQVTLAER